MAVRACPGQLSWFCPKLTLIAVGVGLAWAAVDTASRKPASVLGAK
jgi:hypothetical protein